AGSRRREPANVVCRRRFQSDSYRRGESALRIRAAVQHPPCRSKFRRAPGAALRRSRRLRHHRAPRHLQLGRSIDSARDRQVCRCQAEDGWRPLCLLQRRARLDAASPVAAADLRICETHPTAPRTTTADALRFAKTIKDAGALYFQAYPQVGAFIEAMEGKDLAYLVHENLNESWSALYHADVVADFSPTRLSYACAAHIADDI